MSSNEEVTQKKSAGRPKKNADAEHKEQPKAFLTRARSNTSLYEIYFEGGGEVPQALKGLYTSHTEAQRAAASYANSRRKYYK